MLSIHFPRNHPFFRGLFSHAAIRYVSGNLGLIGAPNSTR